MSPMHRAGRSRPAFGREATFKPLPHEARQFPIVRVFAAVATVAVGGAVWIGLPVVPLDHAAHAVAVMADPPAPVFREQGWCQVPDVERLTVRPDPAWVRPVLAEQVGE